MRRFPWVWLIFGLLALYPWIPGLDESLSVVVEPSLGSALTTLFAYGILALGLHLIVGMTGMFHLGIGAFFGIGGFITGILTATATTYPFHFHWLPTILISGIGAGVVGIVLSGPTLRLRGDYLALVTLGFGEVVRFTLRNLEQITGGTRAINPLAVPVIPMVDPDSWKSPHFETAYLFCLAFLFLVWFLLGNLERSRFGRALVALREDELAASSMGLNVARLKLAAFTIGCFIAGVAGSILAMQQGNSGEPDAYGFNLSINALSCLILGGLGSRNGVLLGVFLLFGFDIIFADLFDRLIPASLADGSKYLRFNFWKMGIFGLALVLMMRFRPSGLISASREVKTVTPAVGKGAGV